MTTTEKLLVVLVAVVLLAGASQHYPGWADPLFARVGVTVPHDYLNSIGGGTSSTVALTIGPSCQAGEYLSGTGTCVLTVNGATVPSSVVLKHNKKGRR